MLKKYLETNNINKAEFCRQVGISRPTLDAILNGEKKDIFYSTAIKIKNLTNLLPWAYIDSYEEIKKIALSSQKAKKEN
jgi:transcriptional regulator with XRE-family HTH domain